MAVFDFLKNKQNRQRLSNKPNSRSLKEKKRANDLKSRKENDLPVKEVENVSGEAKKIAKKGVVVNKSAYRVLMAPIVTEKSTDQGESNKYTFKITPESNKNEVKKAVEIAYNVDVLAVNIINIPKKKRRIGRHIGWRQGYKKAVVTVKKGQKIEMIAR